MINNNTLDEFKRLGFGINITEIESFVADYRQVAQICDTSLYDYEYNQIKELLKSIKPTSEAFSSSILLDTLDNDKYDVLLENNKEELCKTIYGVEDKAVDTIKKYISTKEDELMSVTAIPNIVGIAVSVTYINGHLYRVYLVKDNKKYKNITDITRKILPEYIDEIKDNNLTDFRGKISIKVSNDKIKNILCETMHRIRLGIKTDKLQIIFDDIYTDSDIDYGTRWERIEFIKDIGLNVPHHALIRNIETNLLVDAMEQLGNYFEELYTQEDIAYYENGIVLKDNDTAYKFIYNYKDAEPNRKFESVVKAVNMNNNEESIKLTAKILETKCNDKLNITEIEIPDAIIIANNVISIGSKVQFSVYNRKAVL